MGGRGQSPAQMAMVRSKRAPYTDAREGRLVSAIKWAFVMSRDEPLTTGDLLRRCYLWEWNSKEGHQQWQRANVRRAAGGLAINVGRAASRGRPIVWAPRPGLLDDYTWRSHWRRRGSSAPPGL
jgi:hypothetical protein